MINLTPIITYLPAAIVIAFLLWIYGKACSRHGTRKGFRAGCQYERMRGFVDRRTAQSRKPAFWQGYN